VTITTETAEGAEALVFKVAPHESAIKRYLQARHAGAPIQFK
jgi:hypothetical protein